MLLFDLKKQRETALAKADAILAAAETAKRNLTDAEGTDLDSAMAEVNALNPQITRIESLNTIRAKFPTGVVLTDGPGGKRVRTKRTMSEEYFDGFHKWIASGGTEMSAALVEGTQSAGGYAVPIVVDDQIVPLAPQEMAIRRLATVLPTTSDIKFPTKTAFGSAAIKAETSSFGGGAPTIGQFTLSAFMVGAQNDLSWELAQDVPAFQSFLTQDMLLSQQMLEESYYVSGSGSGQPQGLIGNVGVGVVEEADSNSNLVTINGCLDLIGKLNAIYHANATWVMQRATSIILRKAQVEANLFEPVFTRVGTQDYCFGYPVEYVTDMPAPTRGNTPILFGDFKRGYLIGDRGGSGINVKVLDQPKAAQGLITLLTYRRTDGRVRLAEAIQPYYISAS